MSYYISHTINMMQYDILYIYIYIHRERERERVAASAEDSADCPRRRQ